MLLMLPLPERGLSQVLINHDLIFIIDTLGLQPFHHLHLRPLGGPQGGMAQDLLQSELSEVFRKLQINTKSFSIQCFKIAAK